MGMPAEEGSPHGRVQTRFAEPLTVRIPWGERVALEPTRYTVAIDTFLADFRMIGGGPGLASDEPRNPAVRLDFFEADSLIGSSWYFAFHPAMSVGSGPDLPLRFASFEPEMTTGLDLATHPGSGWIWAGIVIMTIGTLLSFLLRYERAWVRLRRQDRGWEVTLLHQGSPKQAPEYARAEWQRRVTPLAIEMLRRLEPEGGQPVRWPGMKES
jgi:cytochrome c biogenesis protein ResB